MATDNDGLVHIGWAREDSAHDALVKMLARRVVIEDASWDIDHSLEHMWRWAGPHGEPDFKIGSDIELRHRKGRRIPLHGKIGGQPLAPEAGMYRRVLLAFDLATPRPAIVILARDGDRRAVDRRRGFEQVVESFTWSFAVILAMPEPESEAWFLCGFRPTSDDERDAHVKLTRGLSFDPISQPHRLTSKSAVQDTDAKRVLNTLVGTNIARRDVGLLETPLEELARNGEHAGLARFLEELRRDLLPLLDLGVRPS